jgi:hypothetical protein
VMNLGGNDFSTAVKTGEKWPTQAALIADYFDTYDRFLRALYARNPDANLIIFWPGTPSISDAADIALFDAGRSRLETATAAIGFKSVKFTTIPSTGIEALACDYHMSVAEHATVSRWLIALLDANSQFWAGN